MKLFLLLSLFLVNGWCEEHGLQAFLMQSPDSSLLDVQRSTIFQFVLHNPSNRPVTMLKWGTPFENVDDAEFLQVVNVETGEPAVYAGKLISRFLPENLFNAYDEFVTLLPGETVSIDIDVAKGYYLGSDNDTTVFNVSVDTHLSFFFGTFDDAIESSAQGVLISSDSLLLSPLSSDSMEMNVIPELIPDPRHYLRHKLGVSFTGCDETQKGKFNTNIIPLAKSYNDRALAYMTNHRCDRLYVTYFGVYTATRWNLVTTHFRSIKSRLDSGQYGIQCETCNYNAYVYPNDRNHNIHWCHLSWNNNYHGNAGTIIHELSHFDDVAATRDYAYYDATLQLAKTDPDKSVMCAASHSIFAQNSDKC